MKFRVWGLRGFRFEDSGLGGSGLGSVVCQGLLTRRCQEPPPPLATRKALNPIPSTSPTRFLLNFILSSFTYWLLVGNKRLYYIGGRFPSSLPRASKLISTVHPEMSLLLQGGTNGVSIGLGSMTTHEPKEPNIALLRNIP